jgi:16S rRNA (cytosine967-C5)-methyltransferase
VNFLQPAVNVLLAWRRDPQANLKLLLERSLRSLRSGEPDEISRTVYGTARKLLAVEEVIARLSARPLHSLDDRTVVPLQVGLFLLLFSDSYPDYAVVNETVQSAPARSRSFVNALLRGAARRRAAWRADLAGHADLSVRHAVAPLLVQELSRLSKDPDADLAYLDREPQFHLRPRPGCDTPEVARQLLAGGVEFRALPLPGCLETAQAGRVRALMAGGLPVYFQNSGSQLVSFVAAESARADVWDLAAAPGSKTLTLAGLKPGLRLLASDLRPERLRMLRSSLAGLPQTTVRLFAADAARPPLRSSFAGLILADLPCTSSGTLRKNPDLKSRLTPERVAANRARQETILSALLVRYPRAAILYSVCSFLAAETEELLSGLRDRFPCRSEPLAPLAERAGFTVRPGDHGCYLMPGEMNNDMFYISLLRRIE